MLIQEVRAKMVRWLIFLCILLLRYRASHIQNVRWQYPLRCIFWTSYYSPWSDMCWYYNRCNSSNKCSNIRGGSNPGLNFSAQFIVKRVPYKNKVYKIRSDVIGLYISLIKSQTRYSVRKIMNSIPFRQRLWESFLTKTVGKLSDKLCGNLCLTSSSFRQSLWETHVGGSLLGPPLLYISS